MKNEGYLRLHVQRNGGMRDALSLLDRTLSFSEGEITVREAVQVTGSLTRGDDGGLFNKML